MKPRTYKYTIFVLVIGLIFIINSYSQENELKNYRFRFDLTTAKQPDNSRLLIASFVATHKKDRKDIVPVFDATINFYNTNDESEVLLGTAKTDREGTAQLIITGNKTYLTNEEGYTNFKAVFEETDNLDSEEAELAVRDIFLELKLEEIDSVKTVVLNAYTLDSLNTKVPVEGTDIKFAVSGFISNMPIQEGTIEKGEFQFEFPKGISGDKSGNIEVMASIEDNDEFGNVTQKKNINWGVSKKIEAETNKLWSKAAPFWMYIVLSILLFGVWANYAYSIVNLFRIRKEGKDLELRTKK